MDCNSASNCLALSLIAMDSVAPVGTATCCKEGVEATMHLHILGEKHYGKSLRFRCS
ncbi:hypothetical protein BAUCODRAFT_34315, partial [Baudoinia panamericana UAMH 10762]